MVDHDARLDSIFGSLADTTRRDILRRVARQEMSVGEIAAPYDISLAAVSKHLVVLEKARLVTKRREGKLQVVSLRAAALTDAAKQIERWRDIWESRLDRLEKYLEKQG